MMMKKLDFTTINQVMKQYLKLTAFCILNFMLASTSFGQAVDMGIDNAQMAPTPTRFPGAVTFSFDLLTEGGSHELSSDALASNFMQINITLDKLNGTGIVPTGNGAAMFTWTYLPETGVYQGDSKDVILVEDVEYSFIFTDVPTTQVSTANDVGFKVNLVPPGDLLNSQTTDDKLEMYTASPLPVTLVTFNVTKENTTANLAWSTTEETNSERFDIEHSLDAKRWTVVGTQKSNGESSILRNYTFPHAIPGKGTNYYRLKMIDMDGTFAYSRTRSIDIDQVLINVYPNPVADVLIIGTSLTNLSRVQLYNTNGTSVYDSGKNVTDKIAVGNLSGGIYLVRLSYADGTSDTRKIVVKK
jgi:hypothetical protein